jgi:uncharacterized membrane protein required for colicin V production
MNSIPQSKTYLDIAINDYDPVVKAKIYEIVAKSGIPQNDPYIAIFLSNAQVAATVATAPALLQSALTKGFDLGIEKFREFLPTLREAAVKEQEAAITQAIANIVKNKSVQESKGYWGAISLPFIGFCSGLLMIGLVAGIVSGLAIAKLLLVPEVTSQSSKDLAWLNSNDGKLAKNLLVWNRDILTNCLQNQQNLKEALIVLNGKYVSKGLCALWVVPDNQRVFDPRR